MRWHARALVLAMFGCSLRFEGETVRLRDSRGLRFIATLLADPGREFHVLDLAAPAAAGGVTADAGAAIDPAAEPAGPGRRRGRQRHAAAYQPSGSSRPAAATDHGPATLVASRP
jgi:hypothetical protein